MVLLMLSYQRSGSRTVRITFASGKSRTSSRQNHTDGQSTVDQREVGVDTHSFSDALRNAMRQDPDLVRERVRKAVEEVFKVKVLSVNTMRYEGKIKRVGRTMGKRPNWKKAVVTLAPGERIQDFFEGV